MRALIVLLTAIAAAALLAAMLPAITSITPETIHAEYQLDAFPVTETSDPPVPPAPNIMPAPASRPALLFPGFMMKTAAERAQCRLTHAQPE